jgi:hypothetical protein
MFGITAQSNSVAIHVHNFTPYFYVKVDPRSGVSFGPEDLQAFKDLLNKHASAGGGDASMGTPVKAVELVKDRASVMHY